MSGSWSSGNTLDCHPSEPGSIPGSEGIFVRLISPTHQRLELGLSPRTVEMEVPQRVSVNESFSGHVLKNQGDQGAPIN